MPEKVIRQLISDVLTSPNDFKLLKELVLRSKEFFRFLQSNHGSRGIPVDLSARDEEWIRTVFSMLALPTEKAVVLLNDQAAEHLLEKINRDDADIGRRFAELLASLPDYMKQFGQWFNGCPTLNNAEIKINFLTRSDFNECPESVRALATYGIGPLEFFQGIDAVADFLKRMTHENFISDPKHIVADHHAAPKPSDPRRLVDFLMDEICTATGSTPETAEALYRWLRDAAAHRPDIFPGYHAVLMHRKDGIVFSKTEEEGKK